MEDMIQKMHDKYRDLVWYARKPPKDDPWWDDVPARIMKDAFDNMDRVEAEYPEEVEQLQDPDSGDWKHGFNSGMLAALRLVMCAEEFGTEQALELFPELDT